MKQFLLRDSPLPDGRVILSGEDFHYLARVRRVKPGDTIHAERPDGVQARLVVVSVGQDMLTCSAVYEEGVIREMRTEGQPAIILFQAVPQPAKMDTLVRQAAEGGVSAVVPFISRYSVKAARLAARTERWKRIVREARQQSGSPVATLVEETRESVQAALGYYRETSRSFETAAAFVMHEKGDGADGVFHRALASRPGLVSIVIGPEGGLAEDETAAFVENGFVMVNMGQNVLRVETAAAWAVGAVSVILREAESWKLKE